MSEQRPASAWRGRFVERHFTITADLIDAFADLSGDHHPVHMADAFARSHGFSQRVAHGMLLGSLVSQVIGMELPGRHGLLQQVQLSFRSPCYPGTDIVIRLTVEEHIASVDVLRLTCTIHTADGSLIAKGRVQSGVMFTDDSPTQ